MKILLAANMYPSNKYPHYGIFVKNTEEILKTMENVQIKKVVIKKTNNLLVKILSYALFYVSCYAVCELSGIYSGGGSGTGAFSPNNRE